MSENLNIAPETIQDLERCFAEFMDIYRRAMEAAAPIEKRGHELKRAAARASRPMFQHKVFGAPKPSTEQEAMMNALRGDLERYKRDRAKFRKQANLYRNRAKTILAVLEWAASDKQRTERAEGELSRLWNLRWVGEHGRIEVEGSY